MRFPSHFYLRRRRWRVEMTEKIDGPGGALLYGYCDLETRTLIIDEKQSEMALLGTYVHEYLHAIDLEYGLKIPHKLIYKLEKPLARMIYKILYHNLDARK